MKKNLDTGKTAAETSKEFQESKRELLLIGEQVDRLFLSRNSSPLLPEWSPSESDDIFEPSTVEESEGSSESDLEQDQADRRSTERTIPAETTKEDNRDESDPIDQQLTRIRLRIQKMSFTLKQV